MERAARENAPSSIVAAGMELAAERRSRSRPSRLDLRRGTVPRYSGLYVHFSEENFSTHLHLEASRQRLSAAAINSS